MRRSRRRVALSAGVILVLLAVLVSGQPTVVAGRSVIIVERPNIVFVLTDDLSWNLVRFIPQVAKLRSEGMSFNNYAVTDSLCCPSRSSIFTGRFPHDTGVFTNGGRDGGFPYFYRHGEEADTFATALRSRGYRTALMGKYLNGYQPGFTGHGTNTIVEPYVPPGWNEWDVAGNGYMEYNYKLNENHTLVRYGITPSDYLTDVLADKGSAFIKRSARAHKPFMLELSTFAPHSPYTPAPRDAEELSGLVAPRTPAFDQPPTDAPPWLAARGRLSPTSLKLIDKDFRKRAQSVLAVDDLIAKLRATLKSAGVARDTYVIFSSDNGYHMGEYRLSPGKLTAFDTDIRVPLVVAGPGVPAGKSSDAVTANIDLAPTFEELAGARVPAAVDGHSLVSLLRGGSDAGWRTADLVEHHGPVYRVDDPDRQPHGSGNPPSYEAIRTRDYTYVEYVDGNREYYDLKHDRLEMHNLADTLSSARLRDLHEAINRLANCHDGASCWAAGHV